MGSLAALNKFIALAICSVVDCGFEYVLFPLMLHIT